MKFIENIHAVAESAKHSASVSLNAARDAYSLLEAERKGEDEELLQTAAHQFRVKHGCSTAEAFIQVGQRAEYLKELAVGESTFHEAKRQLQAKADQSGAACPEFGLI